MKTIIVDDELSGREILKELLSQHCPQLNIIALVSDGVEAKKLIEEHSPQIVFLDIQMPRMNGFELLNKLQKKDFELIFVTAHDEFAIKAFRYSAIDYLLKPVNIEEMKRAVEESEKRIKLKTPDGRIEFLLASLANTKRAFSDRIILPVKGGFEIIDTGLIIRCESEINYTRFYLLNGNSILVSKTMKEFEQVLLENNFYRIHRSHMVNLNNITKYNNGKGGEVVMSDGSIIKVSREKKDDFIKIIGKK